MSYLPYISDDDLRTAVTTVVNCIIETQARTEEAMYKNVIDPFSAIFDGAVQGFNLEEWLQKERARQVQKTVQNSIGYFHQDILGSIPSWENMGRKNRIDVRNISRQIIAEVKNNYSTVKASNKYVIYDDLLFALDKPEHQDFTAYYVEIIPQGKNSYNRAFTPLAPGNAGRRPLNERIRQISGQAFYELATGEPEALSMLFNILPDVISEVSGLDKLSQQKQASFRSLWANFFCL